MKFAFTTLDVFTSTRYAGNPLAIVMINNFSSPSSSPVLSQFQKQAIAREFNLSETVFIYGGDDATSPWGPKVKIDIFTPQHELPFAGHPTIGTAWFLLHCASRSSKQPITSLSDSATGSSAVNLAFASTESTKRGNIAEILGKGPQLSLLTKAGSIPIQQLYSKPGFVVAEIPHDIHIHAQTMMTPQHLIGPTSSHTNQNPIVSVVKGVSFILVCLPSLALLEKATASLVPNSLMSLGLLDEEWKAGMVGTLFYAEVSKEAEKSKQAGEQEEIDLERKEREIMEYRTRMWVGWEDPATGSASCALAVYLAMQTYKESGARDNRTRAEEEPVRRSYTFTQGVEMGQMSEMGVEVVMSEGLVRSVFLSGTAVKVMEGELEI